MYPFNEAAELMGGMSIKTLHRMIHDGEITAITDRGGRNRWIEGVEIRRWISAQRAGTAS